MTSLLFTLLAGPESRLHLAIEVVFVPCILLLFWRLYKFTLLPILKPTEPARLPYWIPVVGHAISFFKDSEATLTYAKHYFGNTREPFTLTLAGQKLFVLMSPKDMSAVYKNSTTLTFDGFIRDLYTSFGVSPVGIRQMWQMPTSKLPRDSGRELHLGQGIHREQLYPGQHLEDITAKYVDEIEGRLQWEKIPDLVPEEMAGKVVSLYGWCATILGNAATKALFGERLLELEPKLLEHFYTFDSESWKLTFQLPRPFARRMHDAKDSSKEAYTRYFQLPLEDRSDLCHYLRSVEARQREVGMTDQDIAATAQMFFWGANANPYKVLFWLLCHIIFDKKLMQTIRKEVIPSIKNDQLDMDYLLKHSPHLDAAFNETLRVTSVNSSARNVESPVTIGGKLLTTDGKIIMPYRQLHLDESMFGPNTKNFDVSRFLSEEDHSRNPNFKPFGGGNTYCSGRFIAKREVFAFVAFLLHRYDLGLMDANQAFPKMDETKPTLGIMDPIGKNPIRIFVSRRTVQ